MMRAVTLALASLATAHAWSRTRCGDPAGGADIPTPWAADVATRLASAEGVWPEYPRPQLTRGGGEPTGRLPDDGWMSLNGLWEIEPAAPDAPPPFGRELEREILVPFPIESCLSGLGVNTTDGARAFQRAWYRTVFDDPWRADADGHATLLHFGAVDWNASVWLNGALLGTHVGGFDGFDLDASAALVASGNELLVGVFDPSDEGAQPNGKQRVSAIDEPGGDTYTPSSGIFGDDAEALSPLRYTPSSGIWQTVWLERAPAEHVQALRLVSGAATLNLTVTTPTARAPFTVTVSDGARDVRVARGASGAPLVLEFDAPITWSPASPFLYTATITLDAGDEVTT